MKKTTILFFVFALMVFPLFFSSNFIYSMEPGKSLQPCPPLPEDLWQKLFACCDVPSKDILRHTSTIFQRYTPIYYDLYKHKPLIITDRQAESAISFFLTKKDINALDNLLQNNNEYVFYALFEALELSATEQFLYILKKFPPQDINIVRNKTTFLYCAAKNNNFIAMQHLLKHTGCNINYATPKTATPLYVACQEGYTKMVRLLLAHNASIHILFKDSLTPLYIAAMHDHTKVIQVLLNHNKEQLDKPALNGITPLHIATKKGNWKTVKLLCEYNADQHYACAENYIPLYSASKEGKINIVSILLRHTQFQSIQISFALYCASFNNHKGTVKLLLAQKNINTLWTNQGHTCLYAAAYHNYCKVLKLLLKHSPQLINICSPKNASALYVSVEKNFLQATKILLSAGADPNISTTSGETPLDRAYINKNDEIIKLLIAHGAQTNQQKTTESCTMQ